MVGAPSIDFESKVGLGLAFAAAVTLTAIGRSFTWLSPGLMDAQMFAFVGEGWLRGRVPYVHVWDVKPPGIFAINAAVFAAFPKSFGALAVVEGVSIVACAVTIYRLLRHWGANVSGACLAVSVFGITSNLLRYNEHGNLTEIYVLLPAALSMYFFSNSFPALQTRWLLFAGFATGVATLFKLPGLTVFLAQCAFLVVVAITGSHLRLSQLLRSILILSIGLLLAWLPFLLYFAYYGGLQEMVNASFLYPFNYALAQQKSAIRLLSLGYENLKPIAIIWVFAMLGLWVFVVERNEFVRFVRHQKPKSTVALMALGIFWLLFDFAAALAGGRNHPHYFLCLTPSLAVLTGATFFLLTARLNDPVFGRRLRIALFTLVITPLTLFYVDNDLREFVHLQRYGHLLSDDSRGTHELPGFKEQVSALVDYVKSVKNEGDTLFSVESKPWVFTALSMDSPIPVMDLNFRNRFTGSINTKFGYGVLNLLEVSPATFIVDTTKEPEVLAQGDGVYLRFLQLLERRYELVNEFVFSDDHVRLYRRVDPA